MRHKFPVQTVKNLLKLVSIYGSYRKNKTGVPFFGTPGTSDYVDVPYVDRVCWQMKMDSLRQSERTQRN